MADKNAQVEIEDVLDGDDAEDNFDVVEEGSDDDKAAKKAKKDAQSDEDDGDEPDDNLSSQGRQEGDEQRSTNAEKRRARRRSLKSKLDTKDALIRNLQEQLQQTNARVAAQESRSSVQEQAMVGKALQDAKSNLITARAQHSQSLTTADPNAVTTAMDNYHAAMRQVEDLEQLSQNMARQPQQTGVVNNVSVAKNTNAWMGRNSWFDPQLKDRDSKLAKVIDDEVAADGFDPTTSAYWQELDRRLAETLPHRSKRGRMEEVDEDDEDGDAPTQTQQKRQSRQTVGGSGNSSSGGGPRKTVTLSRERIQAIKDAGYWDNVPERNKMIKSYIQYDRVNGAQGR